MRLIGSKAGRVAIKYFGSEEWINLREVKKQILEYAMKIRIRRETFTFHNNPEFNYLTQVLAATFLRHLNTVRNAQKQLQS
ncbi:CLUMA_CG008535, isoform A [Clunio marinus]|uniref:CLUMA_CG008535, isoform A n=1 Tax=Clunio marinus TaxID=568069 RepID=A0A1J1I640_9DIPT|nr:CLUMA_CG008535, isoform A [Clunio marinus]